MELDDNKNSNGLVPEEEYQGEETAQTASDDLEEMKTPGDIPKNEFTDEQVQVEAEQANEKAEEAEGEIELSGAESENLHESDTSSKKQQAQFVSVNKYTCLIKPGIEMEVTDFVAEVLKHRDEMMEVAANFEAENEQRLPQ